MKNKKNIIIIIFLILCIGGFLIKNKITEKNYNNIMLNSIVLQGHKEIKNEILEDKIKVHIYGEVINPGLIELNSGSRIFDAIEIAGGLTSEADISKINLAYILSDGEKVYIANINDKDVMEEESNIDVSKLKVNINIASIEDLTSLNGIGNSLANSIVEYRKQNGKFSNIEDIKNVPGIGESKFEKIKDFICVK